MDFSAVIHAESRSATGNFYAGVFGGLASVNSNHFSQLGTVFFLESEGGPLGVNAFGTAHSDTTIVMGAHVGYAWFDNLSVSFPIMPALELEGYYMNDIELEGRAANNTNRSDERNFLVKYPLNTGVFLFNGVLNLNKSVWGKFTPYVGVGVGSAVMSISNAKSTQLTPAEPGINHYDGDSDASTVTFATQAKAGLRLNLNRQLRLFGEYRFLYLTESDYTFGGSSVVNGHPETSPWQVKVNPQQYHIGTVGVEFNF